MGFIVVVGFAEGTSIQTSLLDFSDQTKNTAHNVTDCHLARLGSNQALTNFAHALNKRNSIPGL
jgi:hypothetical protein